MITAERLTKRYGPVLALDSLTLTVPDGAVLGLLGPNGAGKSTLARLIMGFVFPNGGRLSLGGLHPAQIGFMPERPAFPPRIRARDYLAFAGRLGGISGERLRLAVDARLEQMGLGQAAGALVGSYSRGMLQRLALAATLITEPPCLILDEPMSGLDPLWQKGVREIVRSLRQAGNTVMLSTHRLEDIVGLCSHVAIVHRGRLVRGGTLDEVLPLRDAVQIRVSGPSPEMDARLRSLGSGVAVDGETVTLSGQASGAGSAALRLILDSGAEVVELRRQRMTLEEVYLQAIAGSVAGHEGEEAGR